MKARRKKLWILRRIRNLNLTVSQMTDVYIKEVRSVLEMAVPVWHPSITRRESSEIKGVQRVALRIILGTKHTSYHAACQYLSIDTLEKRHEKLCLNFTKKNLKSQNSRNQEPARRKPDLVKEFRCNTQRYRKSTLPYLARILNEEHHRKN